MRDTENTTDVFKNDGRLSLMLAMTFFLFVRIRNLWLSVRTRETTRDPLNVHIFIELDTGSCEFYEK
jgi:hypothetical protein